MIGPVDVLAAMDAVESWAREVSDQHIDGEDGLRQAYVQDLRDFRTARAAVAELIEALEIGAKAELLFVELTADGRIDCRELWAMELCESFQNFQDARVAAIAKATGETL